MFTPNLLKQATGRHVVVRTSAITVRGTLEAVSAGLIQIGQAEAVEAGMTSTGIDGHILIDLAKTDYIQVVDS
jgi:hypothetical protein